MTTTMGPPPPRNPSTSTTTAESQDKTSEEPSPSSSTSQTRIFPMGPPPPKHSEVQKPETDTGASTNLESDSSQPEPPETGASGTDDANSTKSSSSITNEVKDSVQREKEQGPNNISVPYTIPDWSAPPCHQYSLEVLKDGLIIDQFDVNKKGAYMFGRVDLCDFLLEHPTISRFHAVIQFKSSGEAYLYDLGSTHGTFINKNEVKKKVYVELHVGDVIRFGHSSRLYIFQGPQDLMLPEADLRSIRKAKIQQDMKDMEASLLRAKLEASMADGISWGMQEDAIEENEDEVEEITWQTYKGQLTEKQEKTREKVLKRLEKISHMKKEIDAIRAKDIAQGGLTQGQQTQIARNEQRISQIMEELENLEETLNESIRESIGARAGRTSRGKGKGALEDDEENYLSDDDEFYDRTIKHPKQKTKENQSIETADSLLDKKESILNDIENKRKLLSDEEATGQGKEVFESGDELDAYMSTVSSQLVNDKKDKLQKEITALQSELDRVLYLLRIADPTGEAAKRRELRAEDPTHDISTTLSSGQSERSKPERWENVPGKPEPSPNNSMHKKGPADPITESSKKLEESEIVPNIADDKTTVYVATKPQWLGAAEDKKKQDEQGDRHEPHQDMQENDEFVNYKDRKQILEKSKGTQLPDSSNIENAAPGLIIRKRKAIEKSIVTDVSSSEQSKDAEKEVEDAVSLLLKHSRGYVASEEELRNGNEDVPRQTPVKKEKKKPKRVLGPEKPTFLSSEPDYEAWVPPEGQSGDGRTSLNDRFGY
ncbi:hypothetical protein M9H77_15630 [Catharanthus roseus]|uniref:Uncharacterized protein n=1 Tax=Catharanthus roseus TaxID=4058 RepID=A0ACC0B0F5_CATRO|nr:hypothetical protein M9H77_15630 [Catharanthus roseus]